MARSSITTDLKYSLNRVFLLAKCISKAIRSKSIFKDITALKSGDIFIHFSSHISFDFFSITQYWFNQAQVVYLIWNAINDPLFGYLQVSVRVLKFFLRGASRCEFNVEIYIVQVA